MRAAPRHLLAAAAVLVLAAGCSSTPTPVVHREDLEREVSHGLENEVGVAPDDVDCPGDLEGREGVRMRCTLTAGNDTVDLTLTVTGVDGKMVDYEFEVDETVHHGRS